MVGDEIFVGAKVPLSICSRISMHSTTTSMISTICSLRAPLVSFKHFPISPYTPFTADTKSAHSLPVSGVHIPSLHSNSANDVFASTQIDWFTNPSIKSTNSIGSLHELDTEMKAKGKRARTETMVWEGCGRI